MIPRRIASKEVNKPRALSRICKGHEPLMTRGRSPERDSFKPQPGDRIDGVLLARVILSCSWRSCLGSPSSSQTIDDIRHLASIT